jgi:hypothetical protein
MTPNPTLDIGPDHENQTEVSPEPPAPTFLAEKSVLEIQRMLKEASPRIGRATCGLWDIRSDDALYYRSTLVSYIMLVPVEIQLGDNMKMCHWGCLNDDGRPTILSSSEYLHPR